MNMTVQETVDKSTKSLVWSILIFGLLLIIFIFFKIQFTDMLRDIQEQASQPSQNTSIPPEGVTQEEYIVT